MIWLVGAQGMLGQDVARCFDEQTIVYYPSDREVDITDLSAIERFIADKQIDWIINCAAYTAVDRAEDEPQAASRLNVDGPRNIGIIAERINAQVVHISTDYVFGSLGSELRESRPLTEEDPPAPESVYGDTKLQGEYALQSECSRFYIIRIAWLYGRWGKSFVSTMLRLFKDRGSVKVVDDQVGCPTWSLDVAHLIHTIITVDKGKYGLYHFCGGGKISWYGFALEIARAALEKKLLVAQPLIEPCSSSDFSAKAQRPAWSVLSTKKTSSTFGIRIDSWQVSLEKFLSELDTI